MSRKKFQIIEASCIAGSIVGSFVSAVTGQIAYASAPLAVALSMNLINRTKLQQQTTAEVARLGQSIASLPQPGAETKQLTPLINTKAPIEKVEKLEGRLSDISESVQNKLSSLRKELDVSPRIRQLNERILKIDSYLDLIVRGQVSDLDSNILSANKKLKSQREQIDKLLEEVDSFKSRISELENSDNEYTDATTLDQFDQIHQLLNNIQSSYEYSLICDRSESRNCLIDAIKASKHRLILVCPWLSRTGFYSNVNIINLLEDALKRGVIIDIGWGHLNDIDSQYHQQMTRQEFLEHVNKKGQGWKYEALEQLSNLERMYKGKLNLKLLGTHEKFLTCDYSFGLIGSHNFLTSGSASSERELGLRTNDPGVIKQLIERFDNAVNMEVSYQVTNNQPTSNLNNAYDEDEICF